MMTLPEAQQLADTLNAQPGVNAIPLPNRWTGGYDVTIRYRGHLTLGESPEHAQRMLEAMRR